MLIEQRRWNFGQAPAFSHQLDERFSWGGVRTAYFDVEKGYITRTQVFTDSLNPAPLKRWQYVCKDCLYRADRLQQACEALLTDFPEQEKALRELSVWMAGASALNHAETNSEKTPVSK